MKELFLAKYSVSHTPLVAMPSRPPQLDLYCNSQKPECIQLYQQVKNREKLQGLHIQNMTHKKLKISGWAGGKVDNGGRNKNNCPPRGHVTYSQAPAVCEKNIFHFFRSTQPVENNPSHTPLVAMPSRPPQRIKHRENNNNNHNDES